jgi:Protein of unknown function (DUF1634)
VTRPVDESVFERITALFMILLFWTSFVCLAAGLAVWLGNPTHTSPASLLFAGLMGLLTIPIVRLVAVIAASLRARDWLTLWATVAVMVILFALTLRDAAR